MPENISIVVILGALLCLFNPALAADYSNPTVLASATGGAKNPITAEGDSENGDWNTVQSDYFEIYYRPNANLKSLNRKLKRRMFYLSNTSARKSAITQEGKIAGRFDILFRKVKELLGMRPRLKQIKIKIFEDQRNLNNKYFDIFGKSQNYKAFYVYKYNTIYTSENGISDSVMAHEMGHAVVDHYFAIRPPEKIREMLSQYVDLHLED